MTATVYVDGSYNQVTNVYGSGLVLFIGENPEPILYSQSGCHPIYSKSRNVAGEIFAVILALEICKKLANFEKLTVYYDYNGIEAWYTKAWSAGSAIAKKYMSVAETVPFEVEFKKVKAHSGDRYNNMADRLAKEACGL